MKSLKSTQTNIFPNSATCTAIEYPLNDPDINAVVIQLHGRYPQEGRTVNLECKELVYVIKGSGKLVCEGEEVHLEEGDVALIEMGERFYWEGDMDIFMPCTPAWFPEQHKEVD
jgi:mannose-6-phosphate isomerase-like protein (cupin superfamily)